VSNLITDIKIVDNVFVKLHVFRKIGDTHNGHAHTFDHITLLSSGAVTMKHDNGEKDYSAPYLIVTPKGIRHQFIATEPNTVFCCIHAIRDGDEIDDIADPNITLSQAENLISQYPVNSD